MHFQITEGRIHSVVDPLQNIDGIVKEKVKQEVHGQFSSDMRTILNDSYITLTLSMQLLMTYHSLLFIRMALF